jgi:hypothetical protein
MGQLGRLHFDAVRKMIPSYLGVFGGKESIRILRIMSIHQ